jgi:hypothetical protein
MIEVFVSRPTWVAPEFSAGLDSFYTYIKALGVNPRTLGVSDYPNRSPLDEVIDLVDECAGAIILGYPQITIQTGAIKGNSIEAPVILGTEWNHMEAALVHAKNKPLLVVHHTNVSRGIFERGTFGAFVHQYDLTNPQWVLTEAFVGALNSWKKKCL